MVLIEILFVSFAVAVIWNWWRGKEISFSNILKVGAVVFLVLFVLWTIFVASFVASLMPPFPTY